MRSASAGFSALLAALLLPLALVSVWLHTVVADRADYLARVDPLAAEERVKDAVEGVLVEGLLDQADLAAVGDQLLAAAGLPDLDVLLDLPGDLDERLAEVQDEVGRLLEQAGGDAAAAAETLVRRMVDAVVGSDAFAALWRAAQAAGHSEVVSVLGGQDPLEPGERVVVPLDPFVHAVREELAGLDVRVEQALDGVSLSLPLTSTEDLEAVRVVYRLLEGLWLLLPVTAGALALLAVGLAHRRLRMVAVLGALSSLVCLALLSAMGLARQLLLEQNPSESARVLTARMADAVSAPLREAATSGVLGGMVVLVLAAVLGLLVRAVRRGAGR